MMINLKVDNETFEDAVQINVGGKNIMLEEVTPPVEINMQEKTFFIVDNGVYEVLPDDGYDGLSKVSIDATVESGSNETIGMLEDSITENGTYHRFINPRNDEFIAWNEIQIDVNVPSTGITPSGEYVATANGNYDITNFASLKVDVPIPEGYIKPSGNLNITENGSKNVSQFETVSVNVPIPTFQTYYTGSGSPSSSLGNDGDLYLEV